jgi:hypothetical protein
LSKKKKYQLKIGKQQKQPRTQKETQKNTATRQHICLHKPKQKQHKKPPAQNADKTKHPNTSSSSNDKTTTGTDTPDIKT